MFAGITRVYAGRVFFGCDGDIVAMWFSDVMQFLDECRRVELGMITLCNVHWNKKYVNCFNLLSCDNVI